MQILENVDLRQAIGYGDVLAAKACSERLQSFYSQCTLLGLTSRGSCCQDPMLIAQYGVGQ